METTTKPEGAEMSVIQEGTILVDKWGYDQTNVDFYKVVSAKNGWVQITAIQKTITEHVPQAMGEYVIPFDTSTPDSKKMRRKVQQHGESEYVNTSSYSAASIWEGAPVLQTHTH
jgi:hypothetical protein